MSEKLGKNANDPKEKDPRDETESDGKTHKKPPTDKHQHERARKLITSKD